MEARLSTAARLLREQTAVSHRQVERRLDLLESPTPARLRTVLDLLCGFWAGTEPLIAAWFARHPAVSEQLQWTRRARLDRLRADRVALGALGAVPVAAPVFADVDEAAVLGWLYVTEGSTLGGAVIDRLLRDAGLPQLDCFRPYAEGPQPMWRSYLAQLESWTAGDDVRTGLVVTAGVRTFSALEQWVALERPEVAA